MHGALALSPGVKRTWQAPLAVDSLLHYSMLGSCFACLLASLVGFSSVWLDKEDLLTTKPRFPLVRASEAEVGFALTLPARGVIQLQEDYSVMLDGRTVGTPVDAKLQQLTSAVWIRKKESSAETPVVIFVPSQVKYGRVVNVLNALERADTRDYVLLFEGQSQDEPVWKGQR